MTPSSRGRQDLAACPFCSAALEPFGPDQANHPRNDCWLSSVGVRRNEFERWNRRAGSSTSTSQGAAPACPNNFGHPHDYSLREYGLCAYCKHDEESGNPGAAPGDALDAAGTKARIAHLTHERDTALRANIKLDEEAKFHRVIQRAARELPEG